MSGALKCYVVNLLHDVTPNCVFMINWYFQISIRPLTHSHCAILRLYNSLLIKVEKSMPLLLMHFYNHRTVDYSARRSTNPSAKGIPLSVPVHSPIGILNKVYGGALN